MSKYHFLRMFRETTGTPPLEYRNRIRLEHAKELLQEEKLSIEEVSGMLGYTSASYFSSAFKKAYGVSPKQYQKRPVPESGILPSGKAQRYVSLK